MKYEGIHLLLSGLIVFQICRVAPLFQAKILTNLWQILPLSVLQFQSNKETNNQINNPPKVGREGEKKEGTHIQLSRRLSNVLS